MSEPNRCDQCGGPLLESGPIGGACPRCMIEVGVNSTGSGLPDEINEIGEIGPIAPNITLATIGRYRVLRLIGEGGMGAVYEAEQDQPRRTVALKIIKPGLATPELLRRFEQESQALGRLQHPGIAQIYEAGTADTGFGPQPYFAMEFVRGRNVKEYAAEQHLSTRQRLEMVSRIAEAVQHAHQRGLIHRDLKPANILIDETGQPKILDFGVARAIDSDVQATIQTDMGQLVGTLAYMSPEQVIADPLGVDTRSDVYSLGVILYELLAGRLPSTASRKVHEMIHAIREEDPARLSSIDRSYRGDIETITAKTLEKDKTRRYGSAAEFAADISRYLKDEPVIARPPSPGYQLRKFARRHKAFVAATISIFIVLVSGVAVSTWLAVRARRAESAAVEARDRAVQAELKTATERDAARYARNDAVTARALAQQERDTAVSEKERADTEAGTARALSDFLGKDLLGMANPLAQAQSEEAGRAAVLPNPNLTVREAVDVAAGKISGNFEKQPLVEAALHETIGGIYFGLGVMDKAVAQLDLAVAIRRRVQGWDHRATLKTRSDLATLQSKMVRRLDVAGNVWRELLESSRRVLGDADPLTWRALTQTLAFNEMQGRRQESETLLENILKEESRTIGEDHPTTLATVGLLINSFETPRAAPASQPRNYPAAESFLTRSLSGERTRLGVANAATLNSVRLLAGVYMVQQKYSEAESLLSGQLRDQQHSVGNSHPATLESMRLLADVYTKTGEFAKAQALLETAAKMNHAGADIAAQLLNAAKSAAEYVKLGNNTEAQKLATQALEGYRRIVGGSDSSADPIGKELVALAREFAAKGRRKNADDILAELWNIHRGVLRNMNTHGTATALGEAYRNLGLYGKAEEILADLWNAQRELFGEAHPRTLQTMNQLEFAYWDDGKAEQDDGRPAESKVKLAQAVELVTQHLKILKVSGGEEQDESQVHLLRLGEIYGSEAEFKKAEDAFSTLRRILLPNGTATGLLSGPRVRNVISHLGWALFHQQKYREAEAVLRVDVPFYDRPARPESEVRYNWEGVLGAVLVAENKNYEEAEYRLQSCYKGRLHPIGIGIPAGDVNLFTEQESVAWLVRLYDQWGKPERATEWRAKLQADKPAQSTKKSETSERFQ